MCAHAKEFPHYPSGNEGAANRFCTLVDDLARERICNAELLERNTALQREVAELKERVSTQRIRIIVMSKKLRGASTAVDSVDCGSSRAGANSEEHPSPSASFSSVTPSLRDEGITKNHLEKIRHRVNQTIDGVLNMCQKLAIASDCARYHVVANYDGNSRDRSELLYLLLSGSPRMDLKEALKSQRQSILSPTRRADPNPYVVQRAFLQRMLVDTTLPGPSASCTSKWTHEKSHLYRDVRSELRQRFSVTESDLHSLTPHQVVTLVHAAAYARYDDASDTGGGLFDTFVQNAKRDNRHRRLLFEATTHTEPTLRRNLRFFHAPYTHKGHEIWANWHQRQLEDCDASMWDVAVPISSDDAEEVQVQTDLEYAGLFRWDHCGPDGGEEVRALFRCGAFDCFNHVVRHYGKLFDRVPSVSEMEEVYNAIHSWSSSEASEEQHGSVSSEDELPEHVQFLSRCGNLLAEQFVKSTSDRLSVFQRSAALIWTVIGKKQVELRELRDSINHLCLGSCQHEDKHKRSQSMSQGFQRWPHSLLTLALREAANDMSDRGVLPHLELTRVVRTMFPRLAIRREGSACIRRCSEAMVTTRPDMFTQVQNSTRWEYTREVPVLGWFVSLNIEYDEPFSASNGSHSATKPQWLTRPVVEFAGDFLFFVCMLRILISAGGKLPRSDVFGGPRVHAAALTQEYATFVDSTISDCIGNEENEDKYGF